MDINDIDIEIKKYDKEKNFVISNLTILGILELRGFVARYTTTKHSPNTPVWVVSPPAIKGKGGTYFWTVRFKDSSLWQKVKEKILRMSREHANSL